MTDTPDPSELGSVDIFEGLSNAELRRIAGAGTRVTLPAQWSLIWERTPADKAYIVLDGQLSVRRNKEEIARLGPGDVVGEVAIVNHKLRNASVVTLTESNVLHFTREAVEQLCQEIPTFNRALTVAAQGRLGDTKSS